MNKTKALILATRFLVPLLFLLVVTACKHH